MTVSEYNICVKTHSDGLYRFALKSLRDSDEAQDIVQESFMRLWERRDDVISGKEKSYLFTIGYRLIIDNIRLAKRYTGEGVLLRTEGTNIEQYSDYSQIVGQYIDALPELQKQLIMLRDYEGYSYREIAEITKLSEAQVKVYIFRARTTLKQSIGNINHIL